MTLVPRSLGGRLILGSIFITLFASLATLYGVAVLLERFVTGQIDQRLDNKLVALASQVKVAADGTIRLEGDADGPPFDAPRHQSFWWVGGPKNSVETRWLPSNAFRPPRPADIEAAHPPGPPPAPVGDIDALLDGPPVHARTLRFEGPQGVPVHARVIQRDIDGSKVTLLAAAPRKAIVDPLRDTLSTLGVAVAALGLALLGSAMLLVRVALTPLVRLRTHIADVRTGRRSALPDRQPFELRPLVIELNRLLYQNAESLTRARRHAANLAHGLKTPLATLSLQIDRSEGAERASMQGLIASIERHIRHHLGRARAAILDGPVRTRTALRPRLVDLSEMLKKVYADKRITFTIECPPELSIACEPHDVDEMAGNLLENAFKYADREVRCEASATRTTVVLVIANDGPALQPTDIDRILTPGLRLDEATPGHGFGLPITRELVELYGGTLRLEAGISGGLSVRLELLAAN